jgi:thiol-disulfide isomerase/thioredoxin
MARLTIRISVVAISLLFLLAGPRLLRANDQSFEMVEGEHLSLSDLKGSVVVLHFFASWCGDCMLEAPSFSQLAQSLPSESIKVVGVAIDDSRPAAKEFTEQMKIAFPVLIDHDRILKQRFMVRSIPTTVILDPKGQIASVTDPKTGAKSGRIVGPRDWSARLFRSELEALASSK